MLGLNTIPEQEFINKSDPVWGIQFQGVLNKKKNLFFFFSLKACTNRRHYLEISILVKISIHTPPVFAVPIYSHHSPSLPLSKMITYYHDFQKFT